MSAVATRPRVRRGLWIAGLAVVLLSVGLIAHFVISGALAGFPIEMISRGRSWCFIGGYLALGYVGLVLLGLARPRVRPAASEPINPIPSTRDLSRTVAEPEADGTNSKTDVADDDEV
jgi:hypothetical protein